MTNEVNPNINILQAQIKIPGEPPQFSLALTALLKHPQLGVDTIDAVLGIRKSISQDQQSVLPHASELFRMCEKWVIADSPEGKLKQELNKDDFNGNAVFTYANSTHDGTYNTPLGALIHMVTTTKVVLDARFGDAKEKILAPQRAFKLYFYEDNTNNPENIEAYEKMMAFRTAPEPLSMSEEQQTAYKRKIARVSAAYKTFTKVMIDDNGERKMLTQYDLYEFGAMEDDFNWSDFENLDWNGQVVTIINKINSLL